MIHSQLFCVCVYLNWERCSSGSILQWMSVVSPTSRIACKSIRLRRGRFAYKSFRLQVDSPTSRSFRLQTEFVPPTRSESIHLHSSVFAYTWFEISCEDRWTSLHAGSRRSARVVFDLSRCDAQPTELWATHSKPHFGSSQCVAFRSLTLCPTLWKWSM